MNTAFDTPLDWASIVGLCGTACIIGAYAYLTLVKRPIPSCSTPPI